LRHFEAGLEQKVSWEGQSITSTPLPKYLGVTLDRILSFKAHIEGVIQKVAARNNLLRRVSGTTWGADPATILTTALAICCSCREYAAPVWSGIFPTGTAKLHPSTSFRLSLGRLGRAS